MNKNIILLAAAITAFSSFAGLSWTENFDISKFSINTETIYGTEYSIVNYDDLSKDGAIGMPLLPVEYLRFSVPYNAVNFSLTYTEAAPITISIDAPVEIGRDEYLEQGEPQSFTGVFPVNIAEIINVGYIAGEHKVVTIGLHPVTTNTQSNSISVRSAISINLAWQLKDDLSNEPLQPIFSNFSLPSGDYGFDTSILVNPEDIAANMAPHQNARVANDEEYPYIIITPQRLVKPLERLAALRRVKGYNSKVFALEDILSDPLYADGDVLTGVNDDAGKLRAFLMDAYTKYNTKGVLLGGKYPEMPIRYGRYYRLNPSKDIEDQTPPTDLYFGDLNSSWDDNENGIFGEPSEYSDTYCEINIGRIPFTSEDDVNAYIDKLKIYEFNPGLGDRSYLNKAFMTKQIKCFQEGLDLTLDPYPSFTKLFNGSNLICKFEEEGKLKPTGAEVIEAMNSNPCGVHNFIGHGSPCGVALCGKPRVEDPYAINALDNESFYEIEEIGNGLDCLTNKAYPAWSYSISCTLMPFDTFEPYKVTKNFGESYILGKDYGGVAFFGNTRASIFHSGMKYFNKFFRALYNLYRISNMAIEGAYAGNLMSNCKSLFDSLNGEHLMHNLFGDPLVHLWIKEPDEYNYYTTRSDDCGYYITGVPEDRLLVLSTIEFGPKIKATKSQTTASAFNGSAIGINKLYTFYRKDALPLILPLTLQNIQFQEENVYIAAGDVNCGRAIDNSDGCTEGPVIIPWGCELNIESMGDVYLGWGTELQMGGKLTVKADGTVILNNIIIPNYSSLYIEADNIEIGYNVEFNEDASVTLIERNPKQKVASRSAESVDYRPLVEEGKTWWYEYGYPQSTGLLHDEEVSFSIGKEVELNGKKWHKIIQGIGYINDVDLGEHYTNENVCIGYIQEDNGVIYTKHKPIKTIILSENSPSSWYLYTRTYVPSQSFLASPEQVMYDFSLGINDIYYRNKDYRYNVTGYSTLENSGIVYKIQTLEGNGRSLEFIEGIGAKEGDGLFFDHLCIIMIPTLPCYYPPQLRYVTDASGKIIYEGIGGRRLWEDFAGIENVAAGASEANVKWYNLQGIEVAKPESAGVYIRRKGNDSRKVIIR